MAESTTTDTRSRLTLLAARILFGVLLVAAWEVLADLDVIDVSAFSKPSDIWAFLTDEAFVDSEFWADFWATAQATIIATALAAAVGTAVGVSLGLLPRIEAVVTPYLDAFNAMPRIALAPVFVIVFGISTSAKVALAFTIGVFICLNNASAGVRSIDPQFRRLAHVMGANKLRLIVRVVLPGSVPGIFAGIRLSVIFCLLGVVAAELIASRDGLGQLIQAYAGVFRVDAVFGVLIVLAVFASVLNALMRRVEAYILRWQ
jgi:NitT/TauT family transport system permease protein